MTSDPVPTHVRAKLSGLADAQRKLVIRLCELGQQHIFDDFSRPLIAQLEALDQEYANGGLEGYLTNARQLLADSKAGKNPLEDWKASVPQGQTFTLGTNEYAETEAIGIPELGKVGFVLVAGGLGERLGYSGIKVALPTELASETCYLQYYIEYILALQARFGTKLPLCIMTSGDTNERTVQLLRKNNYFGMDKSQVTIVIQGQGVPALTNNDAKIAVKDSKVVTKPHGHGDIHALLYQDGVARNWLAQGIEWMVFFQDTNGLAFHTLPLMLGVSKKLNLVMNSLAVPRKAKQAIGGIAQLTHRKTKEQRTINVEYNQLDPCLRASGYRQGDVNDRSGFSPFPGNINQLLFRLDAYSATLERTKGIMPEFVNPKYKDDTKQEFKKPTRLECMMQDFPTVLEGEDSKRVGFTSIAADMCFSPVKNATSDGVALQQKGTHPATAASGEADQYAAVRQIMTKIGCKIEEASEETYCGIKVVPGPAIVLKPNFVACPGDYGKRFPSPENVKISAKSTLIVRGDVTIESLDLDGTLVIDVVDGKSLTISDEVVRNAGWVRVPDEDSSKEVIRMRGYHLDRKEVKRIDVRSDECTFCSVM